jgi:hypothetical protein
VLLTAIVGEHTCSDFGVADRISEFETNAVQESVVLSLPDKYFVHRSAWFVEAAALQQV